jgi:hypothetical protein
MTTKPFKLLDGTEDFIQERFDAVNRSFDSDKFADQFLPKSTLNEEDIKEIEDYIKWCEEQLNNLRARIISK